MREGELVANVRAWAVAGLAAATVFMAGAASAKTLTVEQATELLARSVAANSKCRVLSEPDAARLQTYAAQAERRLLQLRDAETTKKVVASGNKTGAAVRCDNTTSNAINAIFKAAQTAVVEAVPRLRGMNDDEALPPSQAAAEIQPEVPVAQADPSVVDVVEGEASVDTTSTPDAESGIVPVSQAEEQPDPAVEPVLVRKSKKTETSNVKPGRQNKKQIAKPEAPAIAKTAKKETPGSGALSSYGRLAQLYYYERRCRNMAQGSLASLYGKVLASHRAAVAQYGSASVRSVLRKAEARASGQSC